jgi:MerR family transcriptional regulator/heat shock protein HspR
LIQNRDARLAATFDLDKPLYTISVASEILETHPRTLMMYEDLGLIEPYRTATNRRRYSQRNVRKLQVIQQLTREKGVNLAGVKYILMLLESLKAGSVRPPDDLRVVYDLYEEII